MGTTADGIVRGPDNKNRCWWGVSPPEYARYHDEEWGFPQANDRRLFEKLCLEGFQSGLSWLTILRKREAFREVFADFDYEKVARFGPKKVDALLADARIVRHRGKIEAAISNARRACDLVDEVGSIAAFVWRFEPPQASRPKKMTEPLLRALTTSAESVSLSKELKLRGWRFVGPTTVYSFMQAVGIVNDHLSGCHVRAAVERARSAFERPG